MKNHHSANLRWFWCISTNQHRNLLQATSEVSSWCVTGIKTTHSTPQHWLMCNWYQVSKQHIQLHKNWSNHVKSIVPSLKTSSFKSMLPQPSPFVYLISPPLLARSRYPWQMPERPHRWCSLPYCFLWQKTILELHAARGFDGWVCVDFLPRELMHQV